MTMRTLNTNEMTQQFDNMFMAPVRAYMALSIDYSEKMINAQMDASKAYVDTGIAQMRQMMDVKDAEGLRSYMEGQQKVAKELAERVKGDTDKVVSLQQDFIQKSQKITEDNVKQAQTAASKLSKTA
jgi:phasin family protein|tara:strand:+ start:463 stop:843 length:381 start_codon:yes stop_codon:yes gene_type:complete